MTLELKETSIGVAGVVLKHAGGLRGCEAKEAVATLTLNNFGLHLPVYQKFPTPTIFSAPRAIKSSLSQSIDPIALHSLGL